MREDFLMLWYCGQVPFRDATWAIIGVAALSFVVGTCLGVYLAVD